MDSPTSVDPRAQALLEAIGSNDGETARALLARDPRLAGARDENGVSALQHALYRRQAGTVRALLDAGLVPDMFEAAALGYEEQLAAYLREDPSCAWAYSADGFTALQLACYFGHAGAARLLLEAGADPNAAATNPMKVQALHSAVSAESREIVELLLARGADPDGRQQQGYTALHSVAHRGDRGMVELLLGYGATADLATDDGRIAADFAAAGGHGEIEQRLRSARG